MDSLRRALRSQVVSCVVLLAAIAVGCETGAPASTDSGGPPDAGDEDASPPDAGPDGGEEPGDGGSDVDGGEDGGAIACIPVASDYTPRVSMSSTDAWPACVSDEGAFAMIDAAAVSTPARVAAYHAMFQATSGAGAPLRYASRDPSSADFTTARTLYAQPNGLGSRVARRTDEHYPSVAGTCTSGTTMLSGCQCPDVAAASPEYCVGPGALLPIIQGAFRAGQTGSGSEPARVLAARIDAALLWFFYVSPYKESLTCSAGRDAKDCDSAWAYYTGQDATGTSDRDGGIGLAAIVRELERETHDRIWDAMLAVRCWRDLDRGTPTAGATFGDATMPDVRDRARSQLDRAMLRAMAAIAIDRLERFRSATGDERAADLAFLATWLAPIAATTLEVIDESTGSVSASHPIAARPSLFDRALRAESASGADFVSAQMSLPEPTDVGGVIDVLARAIPCP